ncbi:hypothetical protein Asp14428_18500 [Actinoplanes sp. NBRC 14428]|uniref:Uncharacterized protein n=1 Tax=Pseudosporangium ferrugineum TaxID=439699 RepID=A0A2T0SBN1_9ACTN|nr:hypothetical protein [Pseudosporangium ferrugineum]PRY30816.1 hypothetical protein CLV70_104368 [Pseudosporangium ferrugineum]BCJ50375.1 hypothetical protein Asp14428_18500 [Actinoplanes sp. NBRC 14428]
MRVVAGVALLAIGATLTAGGAGWPEGRITAIAVAVLTIAAGCATLATRITLFAVAVWGAGWVALAGGIAAGEWVATAGGAVAVVAGGTAFATSNYVTWFGVALLGDALALGAIAWWAWGTGGVVAAAGAAACAVASAAYGVAGLRS